MLNNQVSMEKTDVSPYVAWNTGSFVFVDCRLDKLMNVLSGWNNVKVSFANEKMKEIRFTGNIDKYSGLEHALEALSDVTGRWSRNIIPFVLPSPRSPEHEFSNIQINLS